MHHKSCKKSDVSVVLKCQTCGSENNGEFLLETLSDIESLSNTARHKHDGAKVFVNELLPDILKLARLALKIARRDKSL